MWILNILTKLVLLDTQLIISIHAVLTFVIALCEKNEVSVVLDHLYAHWLGYGVVCVQRHELHTKVPRFNHCLILPQL
jgi:hypothetical protein